MIKQHPDVSIKRFDTFLFVTSLWCWFTLSQHSLQGIEYTTSLQSLKSNVQFPQPSLEPFHKPFAYNTSKTSKYFFSFSTSISCWTPFRTAFRVALGQDSCNGLWPNAPGTHYLWKQSLTGPIPLSGLPSNHIKCELYDSSLVTLLTTGLCSDLNPSVCTVACE